ARTERRGRCRRSHRGGPIGNHTSEFQPPGRRAEAFRPFEAATASGDAEPVRGERAASPVAAGGANERGPPGGRDRTGPAARHRREDADERTGALREPHCLLNVAPANCGDVLPIARLAFTHYSHPQGLPQPVSPGPWRTGSWWRWS